MKDNFYCNYISVGGTYCFHLEIESDDIDSDCKGCSINNTCENCFWKVDGKLGHKYYRECIHQKED